MRRATSRPIVEPLGALSHVTAAVVAEYLRKHKVPPTRVEGPQVLIVDPERTMVYVRWPNGCVRWEGAASFVDRGHTVPAAGALQASPA